MVRLFVIVKLPYGTRRIDISYMDRSGIYLGIRFLLFQVCPTDRPDATVRKVDAIGKKREKNGIFSRFLRKLRVLGVRYRLGALNEGRGYQVTSFWSFAKNFVHIKLANYTKNWPKIGQNCLKVMFLYRTISQERLKRYKIWLHIWTALEFLFNGRWTQIFDISAPSPLKMSSKLANIPKNAIFDKNGCLYIAATRRWYTLGGGYPVRDQEGDVGGVGDTMNN